MTLIGGLAGYDESLYREWLLNHPDERAGAESESDSGLSFHGFTQDTSLLLGIYNQVGLLVSGTLQFKDGKHPEFKPIMPPNATGDVVKRVSADFESMKAFLSM
ncbi:hypothetical protein PL381_05465 [Bifidobacterium adolescentis]|nr:hypothetical protein [Bifidobacterium adolescentis]